MKETSELFVPLGECEYDCDGWPYSQCRMTFSSRFRSGSATCIAPYSSSGQKYSNYPDCATVPESCDRCDDVCARRDGQRNRFAY